LQTYDQSKIQYKVEAIDDDKEPQQWTVKAELLRRDKTIFSKEKTKLFLKQHVEGLNAMFSVKADSIKKYITDKGITETNIFVGILPAFEVSKKYQMQQDKEKNKKESAATNKDGESTKSKKSKKKQGDITKYLDGNAKTKQELSVEEKKKREEESKKFREELEARKKEKADREAEKQKKIAEEKARLLAKTQAAVRDLNQMRDDLELIDQRIMPKGKTISTMIEKKYFAEFMKVLEFLHSFPEVLSISDKFPYGITMDVLERALILKEVNGPLSDIFQVLLGTIFSLQIEEANEIEIDYRINGDIPLKHSKVELMKNASRIHKWFKKNCNLEINLFAMDSTTISELVRLHFATSGALLSERSSKARFQYRGGYKSADDPGLHFVSKHPHIIKFLTQYSIFQLSTRDILRILSCLTDQILTYSNLRDVIEDRLEQATNARLEYKNLKILESRRERKVIEDKKTLQEEYKTIIASYENEQPKQKEALIKKAETELEEKIAKIDAHSSKERLQHLKELKAQVTVFFNHQTYLGSDRAFRNYYIFESVPGLFVEHDITHSGKCLDKFIKNHHALAHCAKEQRYAIIKQMIISEESNALSSDDKENKVVAVDVNGTTAQDKNGIPLNGNKKDNEIEIQKDLFMCNCDAATCFVHSELVDRPTWSFYHTAEEIDALIESLNIRGYREKSLRDQLEANRDLIVDYIKNCPLEKLSFNNIDENNMDEETGGAGDARKSSSRIQKSKFKGKQYDNPNFNCKSGTDVNIIYESTLRQTLLEFEHKLSIGCLGEIKVDDRIIWRKYIEDGDYYALDDNLKWGATKSLSNGHAKLNGNASGGSENNEENCEDDDDGSESLTTVDDFDIAQTVDSGNCSDMEIDDKETTQIKTSEVEAVKLKVRNLSMALLQIEQGIDIKFIRAPFGPLKDIKDKTLMAKALDTARVRLNKWEESLMKSTNFSQVFLHYNILYDSIKWSRSAERIGCLVCRSKSNPEQTLLCDECNKGWHMYCLKPKLTKIPDNDWFCPRCKPENYIVKRNRKRPAVIIQEDSEEEEEEEEESEQEQQESDTENTADETM
jgi:bromodomain adjacent to zinc finger domain protein 1A